MQIVPLTSDEKSKDVHGGRNLESAPGVKLVGFCCARAERRAVSLRGVAAEQCAQFGGALVTEWPGPVLLPWYSAGAVARAVMTQPRANSGCRALWDLRRKRRYLQCGV